MPVIYPGSVQEVLDLGRHAIAASRASGLWVALKVVTNVADSVATASVGLGRVRPQMPIVEWQGGPYVHQPSGNLLPPHSLEMERTLVGPRLELAREYARLNGLNRVTAGGPDAWLGIVAAGAAYHELMEAFRTLGVDPARAGIRVLKLGMVWPLEPGAIRDFARGLTEVVVVEEKGPFVETGVKDVLYDLAERPRVLGKRDEDGAPLVPVEGALDADQLARVIGARLARRGLRIDSVEARLRTLEHLAPAGVDGAPARTPFFCSGCPHNRSTDAPDGATVGLGIGCHTMVLLNQAGKGRVAGLTQMGGEGAQWIGQAPFTGTEHIFQNLGDGTFHHSGSLAIRAAAAAGVNITYKLLYNSAVAMTGGQDVEGVIGVPDLTRWLAIEGVRRVIVTTDEPERYRGVELSPIAEVRPRIELIRAQKELAKVEGVTVLIHDQQCATEKRRLRKRGLLAEPRQRIAINERVCEGCGDCGQKSDCLSVLPIETEFGRKTQIHQASCNKDFSCVEGDCPSFLEVIPGRRERPTVPVLGVELPPPELVVPADDATLRFIGIGGTGVVTISQIVGMAALIDGRRTLGLDMTGLAQKGGPVVSDVRIFSDDGERSNRAVAAGVHGYVGFDLLGAASPGNLFTADPERTVAVVSTSQVPTGSMVIDPSVRFAEVDRSLDVIGRHTRAGLNAYLDAQALSEALFGDHMPTNTLILGAAWQRGLIPLSLGAIEQAIRLNGAAVDKTLAAFHWGRAAIAAPDAVAEATRRELPAPEVAPEARAIVAGVGAPEGGDLERLLEVRVAELIAYQDAAYARRYADFVRSVLLREPASGRTEIAEAVAVALHKLMAYKDEYEVARLHLDPVERARLLAEFGAGAKIRYKLHPPVLRALGMHRKLTLGTWFDPAFRILHAMKRLRGTRLDLFALPKVRRVERALPGEYRDLVDRALARVDAENYATVVELCALPDVIRGYDDVKLRNVALFRERSAALVERLESGASAGPLVITRH
jgi:indolepyruvate ferredoxin oxidoreductase